MMTTISDKVLHAQNPRPLPQGAVQKKKMAPGTQVQQANDSGEFKFFSEQAADFRVLRYQVPGFDQLSLQQKQLAYYLGQATLSGRDIFWDQNYKYNLMVRKSLEAILNSPKTDRKSEDFGKFQIYAKRVFFANGIHHFYSNNKMLPECSQDWFATQLRTCNVAQLPIPAGQSLDQFIDFITPIIFDPKIAPKRVNLDRSVDMIATSSVNFYENVTQVEDSNFYRKLSEKAGANAPSFGLNS